MKKILNFIVFIVPFLVVFKYNTYLYIVFGINIQDQLALGFLTGLGFFLLIQWMSPDIEEMPVKNDYLSSHSIKKEATDYVDTKNEHHIDN